MKTYKLYRELAIAYWEALNDDNLTEAEQRKDAQAFNKFLDSVILVIYSLFGIFSLVSLYFFATRVIL